MGADISELIAGSFRAFNEGGSIGFVEYLVERDALDEEFSFFIQEDLPNGGEWRGVEGFSSMAASWLEAWEEFEFDPGAPEELPDGRRIVPVRQGGVARGSGIELFEEFFYVFELAGGRFSRIALYSERGPAERPPAA